jgi:hypothetical protein
LIRSPIYRARSGFSAATAFAIGLRFGLTPVVVLAAGSGESPNTTNVQFPDPAGVVGAAVVVVVRTGAGDGPVHPQMLAVSITIRNNVNKGNRMGVYLDPDIKKDVIFRSLSF